MSDAVVGSRAPGLLAERLVTDFFSVRDGMLAVGGVAAGELATMFGTPLYIYDADLMRRRYRQLADTVAGFAEVYYSIKANPHPEVAAIFVGEGSGLEIASLGEFQRARAAGASPERIIFAGPGKGRDELETAIRAGIGEIHLESLEEAHHVETIARTVGRRVPVAIRVNPVASAQGGAMRMGGKPTAFGFDEEDLADVVGRLTEFGGLDVRGVHLFAGTQILDADVLICQWRHGLDVASRLAALLDRPLETIDLGGGLGVPYHDGDSVLDLEVLRQRVPGLHAIKAADPGIASARVLLEPGRFLTAPAGVYLASVRAVKKSRGHRFVITDGGMHHHLAASGNLGQVIKRDYPIVAASRMGVSEIAPATLVGPLCTPLDTLGRQTRLPDVQQGDLIAVLQSGAYGLTASPVNFLSHPSAREVLVENGTLRLLEP
jgi:diaminopimelate decarboxylase